MQRIFFRINLIFLLLGSSLSFALDGPSTPGGGGSGRPRCAVYDAGWEEHGYHNSCQECKAKHGDCETKCFSYSYECSARGVDQSGNTVEYKAVHSEEFVARDEALDRCYRSRASQCSVSSCIENSRLQSRNACR